MADDSASNRRRPNTGLTLAAIGTVLVVAGIQAWKNWPVALRYRQGRTVEAGRAVVRRYVGGQDSLSAAVCHLATAIRRYNNLSMRLASMEPRQVRRIEDKPLFVPPGIDPKDPRVEELTGNAYRISIPDAIPAGVRTEIMRLNDSMLRARGFRIVECAT
jgi:hypothetical protein